MATNNVWVIGFDKESGRYEDFCCCPEQDAVLYERLYEDKGYRVEIMTREEIKHFVADESM